MNTPLHIRCASVLLLICWLAPTVVGASTLNDDERNIPMVYRTVGIENQVPYKILYAIALVESGYKAPSNGQYRPWPWTLNFNGDSRRFNNKAQALASLKEGIDQGKRNIDVGIAQINYQYNGSMFPSLDHALDPEINLRLATYVLRREIEQCPSPNWWCAVGRYHSPGPNARQKANADRYQQRVRVMWEQLQ